MGPVHHAAAEKSCSLLPLQGIYLLKGNLDHIHCSRFSLKVTANRPSFLSVHVLLLPLINGIYFPSPWIWAGWWICFNQCSVAEVTLPALRLTLKRPGSFSPHLLRISYHAVRKPKLSSWREKTCGEPLGDKTPCSNGDHMEKSWSNPAKSQYPVPDPWERPLRTSKPSQPAAGGTHMSDASGTLWGAEEPQGEVQIMRYNKLWLFYRTNIFYWCIVNLQCCVSFWCKQSDSVIHIYIYIPFQILFHYRLLQDTEYIPCAIQ